MEDGVSSPEGPGDASELIGQSNRGAVVAAARLDRDGPATEPIWLLRTLGSVEGGSGTVDEQGAQIGVASLCDRAQVSLKAAGSLTRDQAEVAGEAPSGTEAGGIADEGNHGGRGRQADARDGTQILDRRETAGHRLELTLDGADSLFEVTDLGGGRQECRVQMIRDRTRRFRECNGQVGQDVTGALRDDAPPSRRTARRALSRAVRVASHPERRRWRAASVCW
jgi:YD repeat-containing protein